MTALDEFDWLEDLGDEDLAIDDLLAEVDGDYVVLSGSVGSGGRNRFGDVLAVQTLLNKFIVVGSLTGVEPLAPSGSVDSRTVSAIRAFQRQFVRMRRPDGRVDPNGPTLRALNGPALAPAPLTDADRCVTGRGYVRCGSCRANEKRLSQSPPFTLARSFPVVPAALRAYNRQPRLDPLAANAYAQLLAAARSDAIPSPFLRIFSGYRPYRVQAYLWRRKLLPKLSNDPAVRRMARAAFGRTDRALQKITSWPQARMAWRGRFLQELHRGGVPISDSHVRRAMRSAAKGVAPPGRSAHQTGRAVDIDVSHASGFRRASTAKTNVAYQRHQPAFRWMVCNAARFGFYPYIAEPWHWEWNS